MSRENGFINNAKPQSAKIIVSNFCCSPFSLASVSPSHPAPDNRKKNISHAARNTCSRANTPKRRWSFRTAVELDKNSVEARWGLARAYENLGQFYETIGELQRIIDLKPDNLEARVKLGNYYLLTEPPQTAETEKILQEVFARDPNFVEAHVLKASLLATQGKPEREVLNSLDTAVALNPNRAETYVSRARYFMQLDRAAEAEASITKGIAVNPAAALGYIEYGRFLNYTARAAEAEAQFNRAVEVEPKSIEAREAIAEFYLQNRQLEKAENSYKELVAIRENSPESLVALADFYVSVNREDEAANVSKRF
jgi:Tfp pilus assembly protein PilF